MPTLTTQIKKATKLMRSATQKNRQAAALLKEGDVIASQICGNHLNPREVSVAEDRLQAISQEHDRLVNERQAILDQVKAFLTVGILPAGVG